MAELPGTAHPHADDAAAPEPRGFEAYMRQLAHAVDRSDTALITLDAGLGITIHAGELSGAFSVRDALDHVRPSRISHGVRAIEDADLVKRLADEGTVLEVCPGSNVALGVFSRKQQQLRANLVGDRIVDNRAEDDDSIAEKPVEDVVVG